MQGFEEQNFDEKIDLALWKRLFAYALRYKKIVAAIIGTMAYVALIDIAYPLLCSYAIDRFVTPGTTAGFGWFCAVYFGLVILQGLGVFLFVERGGKLEMLLSYDIREDAFRHLQELSFSYYDRTPVGYLLARTINDIARLSEMVAWSFVDIMWAGGFVVGCILSMLILNAKLCLLALLIVPPLTVLSIWFQRAILKHQREVRKTNSQITSAFNEGIMGAQTTKTLVREEENFVEFRQLTVHMYRCSVKAAVLSAMFVPIVMVLGSIATGLSLTFGGSMLASGTITLGTLSAFVSYTTQLIDPIKSIARILAEFQTAQASAERVISLIDTPLEIVEKPEVVEKYGDQFFPKRENWPPIRGDVEFKNVSFAYNEREQVLEDFNLKVSAGQTIALVGETGAGKSTIVNLLCRFYEPTSGEILIDGVDYRERSQLWLESSLGYVLQSPHLFSGTIADNIRFGRPEASMEEVIDAAKMVSAHEFITRFPNGYDTEVGEGGALLSTGQKQLISFARVVLADPKLFVLDEATSSVDTKAEQLIQHAITQVLRGRTSFLIAHRLSTIRDADCILVLRKGKIEESGTHEELLEKRGYYYELYTDQFKQERQRDILAETEGE